MLMVEVRRGACNLDEGILKRGVGNAPVPDQESLTVGADGLKHRCKRHLSTRHFELDGARERVWKHPVFRCSYLLGS